MKKSLVIISFAFIFLLTMSVVSAGIFSRKTGNALRDIQPIEPTSVEPVPKPSGLGNLWGLFGPSKPNVPIDISPLPTRPSTEDGGDLTTDFGGGDFWDGGCEFLEEEEAVLGLGDVGEDGAILNGRFIDLDEDGYLIIDETYAYPLEAGGDYLVPIPNQECHWEASFDGGELYMYTVCPVAEEFVE